MPRSCSQAGPPPDRWFLRPSDQKLAAALLFAAQLALAAMWFRHGSGPGRWVDIDQQPPREIALRIDINRADAAELSLLPKIGPKLAGRIVSWRADHGPFQSLSDLRKVHGVGPKTLETMRPYLQPLPKDSNDPVP